MSSQTITAIGPGRVNIIGDHTDYTFGLCLPMAIHLATTVTGVRGGEFVELDSASEPVVARVPVGVDNPSSIEPFWARYVAGVMKSTDARTGFRGTVTTTVPAGAGLSSSAALEVSVALALGFTGSPIELAKACQRAENEATGVPTGILDQLASAGGREGFAMVMDCRDLSLSYVPIPSDVDIVVVHSGQSRQLGASGYTQRVKECRAAEAVVGPLGDAALNSVDQIEDIVVRKRAEHVISENQRVREFAAAMHSGDVVSAGSIMTASHASLRDDYESSHPVVDALVESVLAKPGVLGARITGGGFGGCIVAMTRPGALAEQPNSWLVKPATGARLL